MSKALSIGLIGGIDGLLWTAHFDDSIGAAGFLLASSFQTVARMQDLFEMVLGTMLGMLAAMLYPDSRGKGESSIQSSPCRNLQLEQDRTVNNT